MHNPIKAHLLDRLRPKEQTMTTHQLSIEEAYKLGQRAHSAGLKFAAGMMAIYWNPDEDPATDLVTHLKTEDDDHYAAEATLLSELACNIGPNPVSGFSDTVPDLRDPGTKGHAVAQLRERAEDPYLTIRCRTVPWNGAECPEWSIPLIDAGPCTTEEEAIVAAFESTKENP